MAAPLFFQTRTTRIGKDGTVRHFDDGYYLPTDDLSYIRHDPTEVVFCEGGTEAEIEAAAHMLDGWDGQSPVSITVAHNGGHDIMCWWPVPAPRPTRGELLLRRWRQWVHLPASRPFTVLAEGEHV